MKILHVSDVEAHGLQNEFFQLGIEFTQLVMEKTSENPNTILLTRKDEEPFLREYCKSIELELKTHSMVYPYGWRIFFIDSYLQADIVHLNITHSYFFSLAMLPEMASSKPTVLSIHCPWFFNGGSSFDWGMRKAVFTDINVDIIVGNGELLKIARNSPITAHHRVHLVMNNTENNYTSDYANKLKDVYNSVLLRSKKT